MQVCTLLQTDNHASTPPLSFLQAGCHSCRPTNSVKALKANTYAQIYINLISNTATDNRLTLLASKHTTAHLTAKKLIDL